MADITRIETMRQPVTTTYHGVAVTDEYRWIEDASSEETKMWTTAQHERTVGYLTALPSYRAIRQRAEEVIGAQATSHAELRYGGGTYFALKHQPPKQQPFLIAVGDLDDAASERVVIDPNALDPNGSTTIDWYVPSPDGRLVAVSLSEHGTENGTLHLFDTSSGEVVGRPHPADHRHGGIARLAWRLAGVLVHALPGAGRAWR